MQDHLFCGSLALSNESFPMGWGRVYGMVLGPGDTPLPSMQMRELNEQTWTMREESLLPFWVPTLCLGTHQYAVHTQIRLKIWYSHLIKTAQTGTRHVPGGGWWRKEISTNSCPDIRLVIATTNVLIPVVHRFL